MINLCQTRFPEIVKGCPAHEAGRHPATLIERIEHFYALAPSDRPTGGEGALLQEALAELRRNAGRLSGVFGGYQPVDTRPPGTPDPPPPRKP